MHRKTLWINIIHTNCSKRKSGRTSMKKQRESSKIKSDKTVMKKQRESRHMTIYVTHISVYPYLTDYSIILNKRELFDVEVEIKIKRPYRTQEIFSFTWQHHKDDSMILNDLNDRNIYHIPESSLRRTWTTNWLNQICSANMWNAAAKEFESIPQLAFFNSFTTTQEYQNHAKNV